MHLIRNSALLALLILLPLTRAEIIPPGGLNPESFYGKDSNQGVYVRESAVALEKFALAQRMEGHREWNKSADVFQEILEKYPDRVVPSQLDKDKNIYQYTSVGMAVQERLAKWPQEGLDVYRARYETTAATMLEQARRDDFASLHKVFGLYFVTDSAKSAGIRLVDLYFESGEFPAAAWLGDRLLKWHPNLVAERPSMLYRTALAYHLSGESEHAADRLAELKTSHADATGRVRGADVLLAESLEQELKMAPVVSETSDADSWPLLGGAPHRARISDAKGRPGAKLFSVELSRPMRGQRMTREQRALAEETEKNDRESGMMLGVMPVVDRGELFFQDGARMYAVSLESGVPLHGWSATYGGERQGQYAIRAIAMPRNQQLTVTLTDDSALAVMGFMDRTAIIMNGGNMGALEQETRLVCLDRATGREKWTMTPKQLPQEIRAVSFTGSPLVVSDNVYVIGRGGVGRQFEDCYVICLDLASGEYRWSSYVASANTANQMWGGDVIPADSTSHLAYSSGRLYVLTNLGALAAVDAYSGAIQWLNIYPRDVANDFEAGMINPRRRRNIGSSLSDVRPWTQNPVMVKDGKVFILPTDSHFILIYDAAAGVEIKRIRLSDLRNCDTLLGVIGDTMVVAGEAMSGGRSIGLLYSFDWKQYQFGQIENSANALLWKKELPSPIRGRGFVTRDSVFIPTSERLHRIALGNGKVEESYPRYPTTWEKGEGPGNVVVTQDHVIIGGSRRVDVFTDMQVARAKLDAQIAAAPADAEPRLRYAEVMFVAGERDVAVQKLDEAIELLGGATAMRSGPERDRTFHDALTFAQKLADEEKADTVAMTGALFDRAAAAADSASQKVNYRVSRAKFARRIRDFAAEARLYQEILSDPQMRLVSLSDNSSAGTVQAAVVAERAIAALIKSSGPAAYAPFEEAASKELDEARATSDPAKLLAVAQVYPNSSVAPQAMLSAADAFEAIGNHRQATQILRRSYLKYPDSPQKSTLIEAMARNYLRMPGRLDVAVARLSQAAKLDPSRRLAKPLVLPDGQTVDNLPLPQALAVLQKLHEQETAHVLADFQLPPPLSPKQRGGGQKKQPPFLPDASGSNIANVASLVLPLREFTRHDRVVTWSSSGLSVYEVGATTPLFASDAVTGVPLLCAWTNDRLLVWSGDEIAALPPDGGGVAGGAVLWKVAVKSLAPVEVVQLDAADNEADTRIIAPGDGPVRIGDGEMVIVANDARRQRMILQNRVRQAMRVADDQPIEAAGGAEQIAFVAPTEDRIIVATTTGRILAIHPDDGSTAWQTRLTNRRISRLEATDDFTVAMLEDDSGKQIVALDTFEGSVVNRWTFGPDGGTYPVNLALSRDGMLVFTLPDRLCGKDLFEPGAELNYQEPPQGGANQRLFEEAGAVGRLAIADGRILAVSDGGHFVRVHSLETGRLVEYADGNQGGLGLLKTESKSRNVWLRTAGPHLYVIGQQSLIAYHLDKPEQVWRKTVDTSVNENFLDAFIGQDYLLLLDQPGDLEADRAAAAPAGAAEAAAPARGRHHRLLAFSRAKLKERDDRESGLWVYIHDLPHTPLPNQWQAVEGGFYYLTADNTLRFLRGARQEPLAQ